MLNPEPCFGLNKTNLTLYYVFVNLLVIFGTRVLLLTSLPLIMETLLQVNYFKITYLFYTHAKSVSVCAHVKSFSLVC